jgi:hypothetical protein
MQLYFQYYKIIIINQEKKTKNFFCSSGLKNIFIFRKMNLVIRKVRNQDLYNVKDTNKDKFMLKEVPKEKAEAYVEKYGVKEKKASKKKSPVKKEEPKKKAEAYVVKEKKASKKKSPVKKEEGIITRIFAKSPKKVRDLEYEANQAIQQFMNQNKGVEQQYKITYLPTKDCYQVKDLATNRIKSNCTTLAKAGNQIQILIKNKTNAKTGFYSSSRIGDYTFAPLSMRVVVTNRKGESKIETLSLSRMGSEYTIGQGATNIRNRIRAQI